MLGWTESVLGRPSTPMFPAKLILHPFFPLPSSLLYSSHSENSFSFFSLENPVSLPFPSVSRLLAADLAPPPIAPHLALTLAGGYANSSLSFLNWLIEARALWRPCLWAALFLSLSPLTTCVLVLSVSSGCIHCNEPCIHLKQHEATVLTIVFSIRKVTANIYKTSLNDLWEKKKLFGTATMNQFDSETIPVQLHTPTQVVKVQIFTHTNTYLSFSVFENSLIDIMHSCVLYPYLNLHN